MPLMSTDGACTMYLCGDVVQRDSYSLQFAPDWFVTQEPLEIWHDDNDYCTDDGDH